MSVARIVYVAAEVVLAGTSQENMPTGTGTAAATVDTKLPASSSSSFTVKPCTAGATAAQRMDSGEPFSACVPARGSITIMP